MIRKSIVVLVVLIAMAAMPLLAENAAVLMDSKLEKLPKVDTDVSFLSGGSNAEGAAASDSGTVFSINGEEYVLRLYDNHFDVVYPEHYTLEDIDAAASVLSGMVSDAVPVYYVVKSREHTVSVSYPDGMGQGTPDEILAILSGGTSASF